MRIHSDFKIYKVGDCYMAAARDEGKKRFCGMLLINKSGAFLWKELEKEISYENLLEKACAKYDASRSDIERDMREFLSKLYEIGALCGGEP